uniref:Uncharacterized protein n=1 Tax=Chromera velia CCMP2878 TaxID=1169474 RepID=A0A0G4I201_9ALVE|eukprot:Cvel_34871.t1-p1 / transcript=Cvel_34871.t1 / gene=Cvel_34871 / organism=Chromera_velia_CCMP2878 / gene_product=Ankyrin repeat domain-containing protein 65, putative / transcript_product=Ankyrin repeat domain-containing protein 65, putative / location=Cvel_scaffold6143:2149-2706(+) / protein_length=159 / sequence_SO=supercontig / SO=protein_coding / is_pseudo=false
MWQLVFQVVTLAVSADAAVVCLHSEDALPLRQCTSGPRIIQHQCNQEGSECWLKVVCPSQETERGSQPVRTLQDEGLNNQLFGAVRRNDTAAVADLLAANTTVDARTSYQRTPLYSAVLSGHAEVVQLLLAAGTTVDAWTSSQRTLLYGAASRGYTEVV